MFKRKPLGLAVAALMAGPMVASAEIDVSFELKNETAFYTRSGQVTGQASSTLSRMATSLPRGAGTRSHESSSVQDFPNQITWSRN